MRVNVRPLASSLPLGLFAFGIGMLLLAAESRGWVPVSQDAQLGLVLAAFVFPLEGTAAVIAFLVRDTLAATVLGLFTTSWLALGLAMVTGRPGELSATIGIFLLGFAAALASLAVAAVGGKPLIALLVALSATRATLYAIYELTGTVALQRAAGYVAAAIFAGAWYAGTAFVLEDLRQRPLLPTLRRGPAATALHGELSDQLSHAEHEAGVRQQL